MGLFRGKGSVVPLHAAPADPTFRRFLHSRKLARAAIVELEAEEACGRLTGRELRSLDMAREIIAGREAPPESSTRVR